MKGDLDEAIVGSEIIKEPTREERNAQRTRENDREKLASWVPKTDLGRKVKSGQVTNLNQIIDSNQKILEQQIVDKLINVKTDLLLMGQSKGKFGGGKRRAWRQTQRKKKEGNVATFSALAVIGDEDGHVGIGQGRAKETLPARDKAVRKAKLEVIRVRRGCASFDCSCDKLHTVPFVVEGKAGSVRITLIPAPQGTGLVAGNEVKKILKLAGIHDVYSKTFGKIRTTFNLAKATMDALEKTNRRLE
ncbi:30S ribosomal protein S5 [Candidatus Pacearchaeota archaeon CG10_big_fil_rev_8_21_14_0_10_32_14]|nr:MAG: 30S ribosomal protein S5 [Candidatus Pacearchaeota archaeon CG10_big_fil_rev_8_21_14_0_10_32_14]